MKKVLSIAMLLLVAFVSNAQTKSVQKPTALTTTSYGNTLDTVTNTASKVTTGWGISDWGTGVTAHVVVTKISGTVGGSIAFQGSMDNTNWSTIGSASTPSDASANYSFNTTVGWKYYRINFTGASTMSASFKAFIFQY